MTYIAHNCVKGGEKGGVKGGKKGGVKGGKKGGEKGGEQSLAFLDNYNRWLTDLTFIQLYL